MGIEQFVKRENLPIVAAVVVILAALGAYYYFGQVKNLPPDASRGLSEEERLMILKELEKNSPPPLSSAEREAALKQLEAGPKPEVELSPEGRLQVLRSLEQQSVAQ